MDGGAESLPGDAKTATLSALKRAAIDRRGRDRLILQVWSAAFWPFLWEKAVKLQSLKGDKCGQNMNETEQN
jgi:hypothetical protein